MAKGCVKHTFFVRRRAYRPRLCRGRYVLRYMLSFADAVRLETLKRIRRHEAYARWVFDENRRRDRRVAPGQIAEHVQLLRPSDWGLAPGFDPYLVRANYKAVAHAIRSAVRDRTYAPRSPTLFQVPKNGGMRDVSLFQVADNALSRMVYRRLVQKNQSVMSARSYAYRSDLTTHDCLQFIRSEWRPNQRLFIAEYDFSDYFGSIRHEHILRTISDQGFLITDGEMAVIEAFLAAPLPVRDRYDENGGIPRERGIPQGTSISLFLANLAASPLDRALERLGVGFVRYADDTIIWSADYAQICRAVEELHTESELIGARLNLEKSKGIRLLVEPGAKAEIKKAEKTDFVGYSLGLKRMAISKKSVASIKTRLSDLAFENLLRRPLDGTQDPTRFSLIDKDYLVFILQARRYLYGDLSEKDLRRYLRGGTRMRRFKGLMAFYPLVDDLDQLTDLDRWLSTMAWLTLRKRARLLSAQGITLAPPHGLDRESLIRFTGQSATTGRPLDLRLPSFRRIAELVRNAAEVYGPNQVAQGGIGYYGRNQ